MPRGVKSKFYILCESSRDKSEHAYFTSFIKAVVKSEIYRFEVLPTKYNTGKELVKSAKKLRKSKDDIFWVAYDKDGYSKHPQTFNEAKDNNINIAFSAISFETWILLHYEYTTQEFRKSLEVIKHIKNRHGYDYEKSATDVYHVIKDRQEIATSRAKKLREQVVKSSSYGTPIYDLNPYTDIDKLIEAIKAFAEENELL